MLEFFVVVLFVFETVVLYFDTLVKIPGLYYSVYPGPSETLRGSNFCCG
jgi:hypothetical protein